MAAHVHLKNEFTEDEKYRKLIRWLKYGKLSFHYHQIPSLISVALLQLKALFILPWSKVHKIIRILPGCEVRIEKSIPRVTVCHHEALPSDAK